VEPIRFGVYTLLGCIPWTLGLAWAGYALGSNWEDVEHAMNGPSYAVAGVVLLLLVGGLVMFIRHRRPGRASRPIPESD
jgi:membrane protein DedA with SNARE-associated domain